MSPFTFIQRRLFTPKITPRYNNHRQTQTIQRLKRLLVQNPGSPQHNEQVVRNALDIYNDEHCDGAENGHHHRDHHVLMVFLKLCSRFKQWNYVLSIWNDVEHRMNSPAKTSDISWSLLFRCCAEAQHIDKSLTVLRWMRDCEYAFKTSNEHKLHCINIVRFLRNCGDCMSVTHWHQIDAIFINNSNVFIATELIHLFAKHDLMRGALHAFDAVDDSGKDIVLVTALMQALMHQNCNERALQIYDAYQTLHDAVSHILALQACIHLNAFERGKRIHGRMSAHHNNNRSSSIQLQATLITFYGTFGEVATAEQIFQSIDRRQLDAVCLNAMMAQLVKNAMYDRCVELYHQHADPRLHTSVSHSLALKAYLHLNDLAHCERIFAVMDVSSDNAQLIESVNAMMTVYNKHGQYKSALLLYDKYSAIRDDITRLLAIKACMNSDNRSRGYEICNRLHRDDGIAPTTHHSTSLLNTMMDFYGHCNDMHLMINVFNAMSEQQITSVSVGIVMKWLVYHHDNTQALQLYDTYETLQNDAIHLMAIKTCINSDDLPTGIAIHERLISEACEGRIACHQIKTALLEMYGTNGDIDNAVKLFDSIDPDAVDIVSCNAMMNAFAQNGRFEQAKQMFYDIINRPKSDALKATNRTFIALFNACSHCDDMSTAERVWVHEIDDAEIKYDEYVVTCLVDGFGRSNELKKAEDIIYEFERHTNTYEKTMWMSLLSACRNQNDQTMLKKVYSEIMRRFDEQEPFDEYMRLASLHLNIAKLNS